MNANAMKLVSGIVVRGWRIIAGPHHPQHDEPADSRHEQPAEQDGHRPLLFPAPDSHPANNLAREAALMIRSTTPAGWQVQVEALMLHEESLVSFYVYLQAPDGIQLGSGQSLDWRTVAHGRVDIRPMLLLRLADSAKEAVQLWESEKIGAIVQASRT